jgi:hypothetical protein
MKSSKIGLSTDPYKKRDSFTPFSVYAARSCNLAPRWNLAFCTVQVALCHRLANESDMDRCEMVYFISEKFEEEVSVTSITRALDKHKMTFKVMRRVAEQQMSELRHFYQYRLKTLGCRSYHLVFIDESGFNKLCVFGRKGWAPKGITPAS